jgi:hypothetical protein
MMAKKHPENYRLLYGLAVTEYNHGYMVAAKEICNKIIKIKPQFSKSYQMLAFIILYHHPLAVQK